VVAGWWVELVAAPIARRIGRAIARGRFAARHAARTDFGRVAETRQGDGPTRVFWNRSYEPAVIARDKVIKESLRVDGAEAESFNAALLHYLRPIVSHAIARAVALEEFSKVQGRKIENLAN
jgi:deoxyribodipyrimidine photo-lyase